MSIKEDIERAVEEQRQVEEAARRPLTDVEQRWISRLRRVMKDKPETLWALAGDRSLAIYLDIDEAARRPLTDVEQRWISRLRRVMKDKPETLWTLAGDRGLAIYLDTDGEAIVQVGSVNADRFGVLRD
jgi:hypothetical protein